VALLDVICVEQADLFGFSLGGMTALETVPGPGGPRRPRGRLLPA
jgi:hypothetical protein